MKSLMFFAVRTGTLGLALIAAAAFGQTDADDDALSAVRACSNIQGDRQRLACFDAALATPEVDLGVEANPVVEERPVRIVEMRRNDFGVTTFVTENGETWVQRSGTRGRFPPVPFDATLQPGLGDTYFLQSPLGGPRARVVSVR